MGHKENIIELLKEHKLGLTYKDLLERYEVKFGCTLWGNENPKYKESPIPKYDNRKNGYYYLKMLIDKRLVKSYTPEDRKGKIVAYKLTEKGLTGESNDSEAKLERLIGIVKDLVINDKISDKQEEELVDICQL